MDKKIEIKTEKGYFDVVGFDDEEYPFVDVEFISDNDSGQNLSRPRILFEYTESQGLRLLIWSDPNSEDYTEEFRFEV